MCIFLIALFLVTFATLPRVDYVEANVLFYLQHLTPLYYVTLLVAIVMAFYHRHSFVGFLSAIVLSLMTFLTPSAIMIHPWFLDTYPFTAEAVYVAREGHIGDIHHLSINPPLGLAFGPFLMITGIDPTILPKVFLGIFSIIFPVLLYLMAKKLKIGKESLVMAPLLFVAIAWPNEFHLSRQGLSLIYYLVSLFLLFHLFFHGANRKIIVLLISQIFLLTMSHPATPIFLTANLIAIALLDRVLPQFHPRECRVITQALFTSGLSWTLWNSISPTKSFRSLIDITTNLVVSLYERPSEVSGTTKIFAKYTPFYTLTINMKFALTAIVMISAILMLLVIYRHLKDRKVALILSGWILSNVFSSIPLLYAGLPFFSRPVLFSIISWPFVGAAFYHILTMKLKSGGYMKLKSFAEVIFLVVFIVVPSFALPLIKYGPLPFLYATSEELESKKFLDAHIQRVSAREHLVYLEYNLPYLYSYIKEGRDENKFLNMWDVYRGGESLDKMDDAVVWINCRLIVRDAFWIYTPPMLEVVENATQVLPERSHNKIYDSGWPEWILVPRSHHAP